MKSHDNEDALLRALDARGFMPALVETASAYHVTVRDLLGRSRVLPIPAARRALWAYCTSKGLSASAVATLFGRDRTTVSQAIAKHNRTTTENVA